MRDAQKPWLVCSASLGISASGWLSIQEWRGVPPLVNHHHTNQGRNFPHENIIGSAIVGGGIAAALIGAGIGHADDNHNHSGERATALGRSRRGEPSRGVSPILPFHADLKLLQEPMPRCSTPSQMTDAAQRFAGRAALIFVPASGWRGTCRRCGIVTAWSS